MFKCLVCFQEFDTELKIIEHVFAHQTVWFPPCKHPKDMKEYRERFNNIGFNLIEEIKKE